MRDGVLKERKDEAHTVTYDIACDCPTYFLRVTQSRNHHLRQLDILLQPQTPTDKNTFAIVPRRVA